MNHDKMPNDEVLRHRREINRLILISWSVIAAVLFVSYGIEVLKGQRTLSYFAVFMSVTLLPLMLCHLRYRRSKADPDFAVGVTVGYCIMYVFVLLTGSTTMVFSYILPMLCFLVLFHNPSLILWTGAASLIANLISVAMRVERGEITISNSKDAEIQIALIVLCFAGAWLSSKMYNSIINSYKAEIEKVNRQNQTIKDLTQNVKEDNLTHLGSRAAYEEMLASMEPGMSIGAIFCDANALKFTNDTRGHKAGDELLIYFADFMLLHFRKNDCFRISGDEFVVLIPNLDREVFEIRAQRFKQAVWAERIPLAAVGWDFNEDASEAVKNAEVRMYVNKQEFRQKYPEYVRL